MGLAPIRGAPADAPNPDFPGMAKPGVQATATATPAPRISMTRGDVEGLRWRVKHARQLIQSWYAKATLDEALAILDDYLRQR